jgi:Uma2 family endonuclease
MNALDQAHPPFTSAEFYKMAAKGAFSGMRVELRRGITLKKGPNYLPHAAAHSDLLFALKAGVERAGLKWQVFSGATVSFGDGFEPMPDIVVVDSAFLPPDGVVPSAAARLIVEVADSFLEDDMGEKRADYARAGLAEYWVADVNAKRVIRHANPKGDAFQTEEPLALSEPMAMLTVPAVVARIK